MGIYVLAVIVLIFILGTALTYNRLVRLRNMVKEGWSGIDVQLKRRATLIPNLVETVKGYVGHERNLLSEIADLRSRSLQTQKVGEKGEIEMALSKSLGSLMAVAEGYPDLKANQNFLELQKELTDIEDQIQTARRYYNGTVRNLNIAVESFPSNIVARLFTFVQAEFFAIDDANDRQAPQVSFGSKDETDSASSSLVLFPWLAFAEGGERIISYDSFITVKPAGDMTVTETIKVVCEGDQIKHGIYRDFPTRYKDKYGNTDEGRLRVPGRPEGRQARALVDRGQGQWRAGICG